MSAPLDERDDTTPLPPPDRESSLDMAHDIPLMPLSDALRVTTAATVAPVPAPAPPVAAPEPAARPPARPHRTTSSMLPTIKPTASPLAKAATKQFAKVEIADPTDDDDGPRGLGFGPPAKPAAPAAAAKVASPTAEEPDTLVQSDAQASRGSVPSLATAAAAKVVVGDKTRAATPTPEETTAVDPEPTTAVDAKPTVAKAAPKSDEHTAVDPEPTGAKPTTDKPDETTAVDPEPTAATDAREAKPDRVATKSRAKTKPSTRPSLTPIPTTPVPAPAPAAAAPAAPHDRAARHLVWGVAFLLAGLLVGIGALVNGSEPAIAVLGFATTAAGIARLALGGLAYPWASRDFAADAGDIMSRQGAAPVVFVITGAMVYLYSGVFGGELIGDDLSFHMAEARRIASCISVGDFDWWNTAANGGYASAYYYQVVPQLMSALPAALFGHFLVFFQLSVFLPLVLAPAAAYRGMRLLGATPWQAAFAALAVGFMNGESRWGAGNAGTFNVGLYTQTWALAALPLALGHIGRWTREGRSLAPAIFWGTFVWLCHPFSGISMFAIVFVAFFARIVSTGIAHLLHVIAGDQPREIDPAHTPLWRSLTAMLNRWSAPPPAWKGVLQEFVRALVLGVVYLIAWSPIYLPLLVDKVGFGGFPHRVGDEVGPGFTTLWTWWSNGAVLDFHGRLFLLTWLFPIAFVIARGPTLRYLWWPAILFAVLLGLGPHVGTTQNDLIPAVRFLGAMQICLALGVGAGTAAILGAIFRAKSGSTTTWWAWLALLVGIGVGGPLLAWSASDAANDSAIAHAIYFVSFHLPSTPQQLHITGVCIIGALTLGLLPLVFFRARGEFAIRTTYASLAAAALVFALYGHGDALRGKVHTLPEYANNHPAELTDINEHLAQLPPGRKQAAPGTENHWWNLLSFVYTERPSLLQMGGGGLQASPNYDFLWNTIKAYTKLAWLYDAPYLVFQTSKASEVPAGKTIYDSENYEIRRIRGGGLVAPIAITGVLPPGPTDAHTKAHDAAIAWIKGDGPEKDQMLAYDGSGPATPLGDGRVMRSWRQDSGGDNADIVAEVIGTTPTTYVIRESWHPRWHAYVDGNPVAIRRVTPDFSAVDVQAPGKHTIALRFERPWWALACWALWPLLTLLAWLAFRRRTTAFFG